jgi:hypothetical protein
VLIDYEFEKIHIKFINNFSLIFIIANYDLKYLEILGKGRHRQRHRIV